MQVRSVWHEKALHRPTWAFSELPREHAPSAGSHQLMLQAGHSFQQSEGKGACKQWAEAHLLRRQETPETLRGKGRRTGIRTCKRPVTKAGSVSRPLRKGSLFIQLVLWLPRADCQRAVQWRGKKIPLARNGLYEGHQAGTHTNSSSPWLGEMSGTSWS